MARSARIAMLARLYVLLSEHPEYMTDDVGARIDRSLSAPVPLGFADQTLLMAATEIDRFCGYTVAMLRSQSSKLLIDALGVLDPDRILAIYYALPDRRRKSVLSDAAWNYHVQNQPPELPGVLEAISSLIEEEARMAADRARLDASVPDAVVRSYKRVDRTMLRHQAGLSVMVTDDEQRAIDDSEARGRLLLNNIGAIAEEIAKLDDPCNLEAFNAACDRAVARMR
jgi:hypothetical protein